MRRLLLTLSMLVGCDAEGLPVYLVDARDGSYDFTAVEEACEFWGVTCVEHDNQDESIVVIMTRGWSGRTTEGTKCAGLTKESWIPMTWTGDDDAIYHEMGHVLGLADLADGEGGNVMSPSLRIAERVATHDQREHAQRRAVVLQNRLR